MKKVTFALLLLIGLVMISCTVPEEAAPLVIAEIDTVDGDLGEAIVIVFEGMTTPITDAEVYIDDILSDGQFFGLYGFSDFGAIDFSEGTVHTVRVEANGFTIEGTVTMPETPVVTNLGDYPGPYDTSDQLDFDYTFDDIPTWVGVSVDTYDTADEEGYSVAEHALAVGTVSLPANTLATDIATVRVHVGGMEFSDLNDAAAGSQFIANAKTPVDIDLNL